MRTGATPQLLTSKQLIKKVTALLSQEYGLPKGHPEGTPMEVLIETILSQNTSDTNSARAFKSLVAAFPTWEDVERAEPSAIADAIRSGGLAEIKARRIKLVLEKVKAKRGNLDMDFLDDLPLNDALDWLKDLPGVGDKTASCVLLFSFGQPAFPVDTHIHRVTGRLGLIEAGISANKAHSQLQDSVPSDLVYSFHVLLIEHGRRVCKAIRPKCAICVLAAVCPSRDQFIAPSSVPGMVRAQSLP